MIGIVIAITICCICIFNINKEIKNKHNNLMIILLIISLFLFLYDISSPAEEIIRSEYYSSQYEISGITIEFDEPKKITIISRKSTRPLTVFKYRQIYKLIISDQKFQSNKAERE